MRRILTPSQEKKMATQGDEKKKSIIPKLTTVCLGFLLAVFLQIGRGGVSADISCEKTQFIAEGECQTCPNNCINCSSATTCHKCNDGFFGPACKHTCPKCSTGHNVCHKVYGHCFLGCKDGTFSSAGICSPCLDHCTICDSPTNCILCDDGHWGTACKQECRGCHRCEKADGKCLPQETDASSVTTDKEVVAWRICGSISIFINIVAGIAMLLQKYPITTSNQSIRQWIRQKRTQRSCENNHSENHGNTEEGHRKCPLVCIEMESEEKQKHAEESHSSDDIVCNGEDPNNSILKMTGTERQPLSHRPQSPSDNERLENPETTRSNQGSQFFPENEPLLHKSNLIGTDSMPFQATSLCTSHSSLQLTKEEPHTSYNSIQKQESICPSDKPDNLEANKPLDASPKEGVLRKLKQDKTDQQTPQTEEGHILSVTKSNQPSTGTAQYTEIAQMTAMMSQPLIEDRRLTTSGTDCPASVDIKNERKRTELGETQTLRKKLS